MTLPNPTHPDQRVQRNFRALENRFPLQQQDVSDGAIGSAELADEAVTAAKLGHDLGTWFAPPQIGAIANTVATANRLYYSQVVIPAPATITGVVYTIGTTANGNVRSALYDASGARVANRTTNLAQSGVLASDKVAFDATYDALPGVYFVATLFSSGTGTFFAPNAIYAPAGGATQGGFTTPATITLPTVVAGGNPSMTTY